MSERVISDSGTPQDTQNSYKCQSVPSLDRTETEFVSYANGREAESSIRMLKANVVHPEFAFEDANVEVRTSDRTFRVHEFQLSKFTKIRELIQEARKAGSISDSGNHVKIVCDGNSVDFYNTFRVLYSLVIFGVPEFEVDILISTLRIASAYDYAELKHFATDELEKCSLSSIDQIKLSDECFLPSWEKPAFVDLCYRTEPITRSEAQILGMDRFVEIARVREAQQRDSFIRMFEGLMRPYHLFAQVEIPDKASALRCDTELLPRRATQPGCGCEIHRDESGARFLSRCRNHKFGPATLKELPTVFEQRNELISQLAALNAAAATEKRDAVDVMKIACVESELDRASWIRRDSKSSPVFQSTSGMSHNQAEFLVPDLNGRPLFEPGDGDMVLIVDGTRIETHRYLIKRFVKWEDIGVKLQPGSSMNLTGTIPSEDLLRMLRVLYATTLEGPFEFDIPTLVSSLHLATEYEYPALREYAIRHLGGAELTAIQRIEIARKFDLPSWEKPAYIDLCNRDEAITEEEANILGIAALVRISKIREKEQRRRGREIDVKHKEQGIKLEQLKVENLEETNTFSPENKLSEETPSEIGSIDDKKSSELTSEHQEKETNTEARLEAHQDQIEVSEANTHPSFTDVSITGIYHSDIHMLRGLPTPGCSCQYHERSGGTSQRSCILPPCAVATFKNLQNGQLAHAKKIEDLCLSLDELQGTSKPELDFDQEVGAQSLVNPSIHEQVCLMLAELS